MTSRTRSSLEFGSDSFLDIIANIVGILIILIVIAGLRVSRAPASSSTSETDGDITLVESDVLADLSSITTPVAPDLISEHNLQLPPPDVVNTSVASGPRPVLKVTLPPSSHRDALAHAAQTQQDLNRQLQRTQARYQQAVANAEALETALHNLQKASQDASDTQRASNLEIQHLQQAVRDAQARSRALAKAWESVVSTKPPTTAIRHRLTSIGHTVRGDEMHFRIAAERISVVPVKALQQRLKAQVMRNKSWLAKYHKHEGYVGPVDGFTMTYVVERQALSRIEQLRTGSGGIRIGVSKWTIHRQPDLQTESVDEALDVDGRFRQLVQLAPEDTVLTFWIYPDSFAAYRQLREFTHQLGFTVAGRPLPQGAEISGSPHGSRSSGQ